MTTWLGAISALMALAVSSCGNGRSSGKDAAPADRDATPVPYDAGPLPNDGGHIPPADAAPMPDGAPGSCGYRNLGQRLQVDTDIELCLPPVVCTAETCPPPLGTCGGGKCIFNPDYAGLTTLREAWATHYCDLAGAGCHGVSQINFAEETAAMVSSALGFPLCYAAAAGSAKCIGIVASSPMVVGNSEVAIDPATGDFVEAWGLGTTEASGLCYEITGPGGTAIVAVTDRCGGYCRCEVPWFHECGTCVSADDMEPNCACVGPVPGLYSDCCGRGCPTTVLECDWCASNNHPHFDLDNDTFGWVCGAEAVQGSCRLSFAKFVACLPANPDWPPNSGRTCHDEDGTFFCDGVSPAREQPVVPGTDCCCKWGLSPHPDGTCA